MMRGICMALVLATGFFGTYVCAIEGKAQCVMLQNREETYQQIKTEEIPELVIDSFKDLFSGYQIDKAFKGDKNTCKLEVSHESIRYILFYKESGELLKAEQPMIREKDLSKKQPIRSCVFPDEEIALPGIPAFRVDFLYIFTGIPR